MTDTDKLKRLAELGRKSNVGIVCVPPDCEDILALIAENERLIEQYRTAMDRAEELGFAAEGLKQQRDEAVALLRDVALWIENGGENFPWDLIDSIPGFLARIDAVTKPVA